MNHKTNSLRQKPQQQARNPVTTLQSVGPLWKYFLPLLALGLAARIGFALNSEMPLHPDEVMQYLEQAHRIVFGAGIVPWEYLAGTRSYLLPGFIAGILYLHSLLGLDQPAIYINTLKIVFSVMSMAIPAAMYLCCRKHFSEQTARIALLFGCFWYELIMLAHKPFTEFVATDLLALAVIFYASKLTDWRVLVIAVLSTLALATRMQLGPVIAVALLVLLIALPAAQRKYLILGGLGTVVAVGALDYLTWGYWWASYYNNVFYNVFQNISSTLFGVTPFYQYLWLLVISTLGLFYGVVATALYHWKRYGFLLALLAIIIVIHSFIGHKEYRFIFTVIPIWLIIAADLIHHCRYRISLALQAAVAGVSLLGFSNHLPLQDGVHQIITISNYTEFHAQRADLQAMIYLSELDNVTGVWDMANGASFTGGGYFYLHKKVPLYFRGNASLAKNAPKINLINYVSHIVATQGTISKLPGFRLIKTFATGAAELRGKSSAPVYHHTWDVEVWERTIPVKQHRVWNSYKVPATTPHQLAVMPDGTIRLITPNPGNFKWAFRGFNP